MKSPVSPTTPTTPAAANTGTSSANAPPVLAPGTTMLSRWRVLSKLGQGAFGQTLEAFDLTLDRRVAIKFEVSTAAKAVLKLEICILKKLQECPYTADFYATGSIEIGTPPTPQTFMAMELLGSNLSDLRKQTQGNRFSMSTTALLGKQMIDALRWVHQSGYLHRDVKPSNFVMSLKRVPDDRGVVRPRCYIIDFGLSRRFMTPEGAVREPRPTAGFRGTARYASLNAHENKELARRDDFWSIFYLLVEFLTGQLPWRRERDRDAVYRIKRACQSPAVLLDGVVQPLHAFYAHVDQLDYTTVPDYDYLMGLMDLLLVESGEHPSVPYDWERTAPIPPHAMHPAIKSNAITAAVAAATGAKAAPPPPSTPAPAPAAYHHQHPPTPAATASPIIPADHAAAQRRRYPVNSNSNDPAARHHAIVSSLGMNAYAAAHGGAGGGSTSGNRRSAAVAPPPPSAPALPPRPDSPTPSPPPMVVGTALRGRPPASSAGEMLAPSPPASSSGVHATAPSNAAIYRAPGVVRPLSPSSYGGGGSSDRRPGSVKSEKSGGVLQRLQRGVRGLQERLLKPHHHHGAAGYTAGGGPASPSRLVSTGGSTRGRSPLAADQLDAMHKVHDSKFTLGGTGGTGSSAPDFADAAIAAAAAVAGTGNHHAPVYSPPKLAPARFRRFRLPGHGHGHGHGGHAGAGDGGKTAGPGSTGAVTSPERRFSLFRSSDKWDAVSPVRP
ncbi:hypothetical protein H9P43_007786 [Blastocladiella emersonii ATCC 22665]|nr:hypothetical protein H9P43_007786 [Blastocladiella emersonii ATCC 22665]